MNNTKYKYCFLKYIYVLLFLISSCVIVSFCNGLSTCLQTYLIVFLAALIIWTLNLIINKHGSKTKSSLAKILLFKIDKKEKRWCVTLTIILTLCVVLANFESYKNQGNTLFVNICVCLSFIYAFAYSWYYVVTFVFKLLNIKKVDKLERCKKRASVNKTFFISWIVIAVFYLAHLFMIDYPGICNWDAWYQINEISTGNYDALYAYAHTQIIHLFYIVGMGIFNDIYITILLYCICMCIIFALCLSWIVRFLAEINVDIKWRILTVLFFAILPVFNFTGITMYSDLPFACCVVIFTITMFRIAYAIIKVNAFHYILLFVSCLGIALLRSNGVFVFILITICFIFFYKKKLIDNSIKYFKLFSTCLCATIIAIIFLGPVCGYLGVVPIDPANYLTVPAQQVGRIVVKDNALTEDQEQLINKVVNIDNIKGHYDRYVYDPLKNQIRSYGDQQYLIENWTEYLKLYFELGIKYPLSYVAAYVDTTSNYWNSDINSILFYDANITWLEHQYDRYAVSDFVYQTYYSFVQALDDYLPCLQSMGLYFWITLILFVFVLSKKNWKLAFMFVPVMSVLLSIFISAPTDNQIRFVLSMYCLLPFFLSTVKFWNINLKTK